MGQKLFTLGNKYPAIFLYIVAALCLFGSSTYLLDTHPEGASANYWTYNFPLGVVLALVGLGLGYGGYWFWRRQLIGYEFGVARYVGNQSLFVRYDELKWFNLSTTNYAGAGLKQSAINFCTKDGVVFGGIAQSNPGKTDKRILMAEKLATNAMVARMEKEVAQGKQVPWLYSGKTQSVVHLTADGILIVASNTFVSFSELEIWVENGKFALSNAVDQVFSGDCGMGNFLPGLAIAEKRGAAIGSI